MVYGMQRDVPCRPSHSEYPNGGQLLWAPSSPKFGVGGMCPKFGVGGMCPPKKPQCKPLIPECANINLNMTGGLIGAFRCGLGCEI